MMRFKDCKTRKEWSATDPDAFLSGDVLKEQETSCLGHRERLLQTLSETMLCEHLMILCGDGTSLQLNVKDGKPLDPPIVPSHQDLWQAVWEKTEAKEVGLFQKVLNYVSYAPAQGQEQIQCLISACRVSERFKSVPLIKDFLALAEEEIAVQCRFLKPDDDLPAHETILRRVARRPAALQRTQIFTTNYDLCFEKAASNTRFLVQDGFSHTLPQEFDVSFYSYDWVRRDESSSQLGFVPNVIQLYKLHGSVDWERTSEGVLKNPSAQRPLLYCPSHDRSEFVIESPFLELMSQFQVGLRRPNTGLLVLGFEFNQDHLAKPILQAARFNVALRIVAALPKYDFHHNPNQQALKALVDSGDPRITLCESTFEEMARMLPDVATFSTVSSATDRKTVPLARAA